MEIVLNFEKKELVVKQASNIKQLYKRLKNLLGQDLENWTVISEVSYLNTDWWYHKPYHTHPWPQVTGEWVDTSATTNIYCLSDQVQATAEFKIDGKELASVIGRSENGTSQF